MNKNFFDKIFSSFSLKEKDQTWGSFVLEMLILIAIVFFIKIYIFQLFRVSGPSMCPTLNQLKNGCEYGSGELIFVNEFVYNFLQAPQRGEIVVFKEPLLKKNLIKRVMGVPGDTIEIIDGNVYRLNKENDEKIPLQEPYLSEKNRGMTRTSKQKFVVPEETYLLFGDNRLESLDSRLCFSNGCNEHNTAYVDKNSIKGRAEFVIWPTPRKLETIDY